MGASPRQAGSWRGAGGQRKKSFLAARQYIDDGGVLEFAFGADGVEAFAHAFEMADGLDVVLRQISSSTSAEAGKSAAPGGAEGLQQGGVLEFAEDARMQAVGIEELIEGAAQGGVARGQEDRGAFEALGKFLAYLAARVLAPKKVTPASPRRWL